MCNYGEKAAKFHCGGCGNCAQAVFAAFEDKTGLDQATALRLASSFGGGLGGMKEACGALTGALMAFGMICAPADASDKEAKARHYARVQEFCSRFKARNSSILCRELLASGYAPEMGFSADYFAKPCDRYIYNAAEILAEMLKEIEADKI